MNIRLIAAMLFLGLLGFGVVILWNLAPYEPLTREEMSLRPRSVPARTTDFTEMNRIIGELQSEIESSDARNGRFEIRSR